MDFSISVPHIAERHHEKLVEIIPTYLIAARRFICYYIKNNAIHLLRVDSPASESVNGYFTIRSNSCTQLSTMILPGIFLFNHHLPSPNAIPNAISTTLDNPGRPQRR